MLETSEQRGRYILDAIRDEARRLERAGHGFDYTCRVTEQQLDEILDAPGLLRLRTVEIATLRVASFVVSGFSLCLMNTGKEREGVALTPGLAIGDLTIAMKRGG